MKKFIECKRTYFEEKKVFECYLVEKRSSEVVLIYEISAPMEFLGINFLPGSRSFGYFWTEKNYNVYHWIDSNDKTIVFYFNISKDTNIFENSVEWKDMIVDIVAFPNGKTLTVDQDEVPKTITADDLTIIEKTNREILSDLKKITSELDARTSNIIRSLPSF
jgi:protein associated with RNAse G/E